MSHFSAGIPRWSGYGYPPPSSAARVAEAQVEGERYLPLPEHVPASQFHLTVDAVVEAEAVVLERLSDLTAECGPWRACMALFTALAGEVPDVA